MSPPDDVEVLLEDFQSIENRIDQGRVAEFSLKQAEVLAIELDPERLTLQVLEPPLTQEPVPVLDDPKPDRVIPQVLPLFLTLDPFEALGLLFPTPLETHLVVGEQRQDRFGHQVEHRDLRESERVRSLTNHGWLPILDSQACLAIQAACLSLYYWIPSEGVSGVEDFLRLIDHSLYRMRLRPCKHFDCGDPRSACEDAETLHGSFLISLPCTDILRHLHAIANLSLHRDSLVSLSLLSRFPLSFARSSPLSSQFVNRGCDRLAGLEPGERLADQESHSSPGPAAKGPSDSSPTARQRTRPSRVAQIRCTPRSEIRSGSPASSSE